MATIVRYFFLAALAASATVMALFLPPIDRAPEVTSATTTQEVAYEIDVLPSRNVLSATHEDVRQTSGWHVDTGSGSRFDAIDLAGLSATTKNLLDDDPNADHESDNVHAIFRVVKSNPAKVLSAKVVALFDPDDGWCSGLQIAIREEITDPRGITAQVFLAQLNYLHVVPSVDIDDDIPLVGGTGAKKVGEVIYFGDDNCKTDGDHLHQSANTPEAATAVWRNVERDYRTDDDGLGLDPRSLGYALTAQWFCSDTWVFKIYPPRPADRTKDEWEPHATTIARCAAPDNEPDSLMATRGNGQLTLNWNRPTVDTVTRYEVRKRLSSATPGDAIVWGDGTSTISERTTTDGTTYDWSARCTAVSQSRSDSAATRARAESAANRWIEVNCDWAPIPLSNAMTTEHIVSGLTNGTAYTIQVRAKNTHGVGPPATVTGTPTAPPPPPPPEEPIVTIALQSPSSGTMEEGGTATFVLTRTRDTLASALFVLVDVSETRSMIAEAPSEVLMPAGLRTHAFEVRTDDDGTDELASVITATVLDRGAAYDPGSPDSATVAVTDNDPATLSVRIAARVVASGRVEVALQQRGADGQWGSRRLPAVRFLEVVADIGAWKVTRPALTVSAPLTGHSADLRITARRLADSSAEFGLQQLGADGQWGARILPRVRFLHTDEAIVDTWYPTSEVTVETASVGAARGQAQAEDPGDDQSMESDPGETFADPPPGDLADDQFMQPEN